MKQPLPIKHQADRWWQRIAWFIGLWVAGVAVVGVIAFALRKVLIG